MRERGFHTKAIHGTGTRFPLR
ncbi:MAG: hypothetical protein XU14_C0105G0001, partial [Armatimonadetes bacterium CSP1-3]